MVSLVTFSSTTYANLQSNKFCTPRQVLSPGTIPDQAYTLGNPSYNVAITGFTITNTCSDLVWTYSATKLVSGVE